MQTRLRRGRSARHRRAALCFPRAGARVRSRAAMV